MDIRLVAGFLLLGGIFLINGGIRYRKGHNKHHFITSIARLGNLAWMSLPLGIMCILWAIALLLPMKLGWLSILLLILGLGAAFLGFIFALFQVSFMKPAWLKWLEQEHGEIMPLLRQEARQMGLDIWQQRVRTREGLEEWVTEVRRKHGM